MVLLVVDTQKGIVDERLYAFKKFVSNIRELIRTAREMCIRDSPCAGGQRDACVHPVR